MPGKSKQAPPDSKVPICGAINKRGKVCQLPAGLGVPDSLGHGHCMHCRDAEVTAGDDVKDMSLAQAQRLQPKKGHFRYEMEGDSRLATILRGMGAEMVVDVEKSGVAHLDLDFEMKAMRAMLILFMERYEEREEALLSWAKAYEEGTLMSPPPRNLLTVEQGHKAVIGIAQVAKTMHDIQQSVPRSEFLQILTDMADVVNAMVEDPKVRRKIQRQWLQVCGRYVA